MEDLSIGEYDASELKIAAEFLTHWLPYLTKDLCQECGSSLRDRVRSLGRGGNEGSSGMKESSADHGENAEGSRPADRVRMSWADMAQEDELERESEEEKVSISGEDDGKQVIEDENDVEEFSQTSVHSELKGKKTGLSREQRENIRFTNVSRKKDFICLERLDHKITNILEGLELHTGVFSSAEQKRIANFVDEIQRKGRIEETSEKKTRDKEPVPIQFGCCTVSSMDKDGNPRGITKRDTADEYIPSLFKVMIKRLIRWHVLPPSSIPDSCEVHILEPGNFISPRIVTRDFLRPFCAVSLVNDCDILIGSATISLPVGSAFVFNGNGANLTKHCVIGVPRQRILITFWKMDEARRPLGFHPESDLLEILPLGQERHVAKKKPSRRRKSSRVVVDGRSRDDSPPPLGSQGISPLSSGRTVIVDQRRIIVRRNLEDTASDSLVESRSANRFPVDGRPRHPRR